MSNRNAAAGSWYDLVIAAAQRTAFDAPFPGAAGTVQFLADFSDPSFRSDLFMLDVRTHDLRELTDFHNVIPEFHWNHRYSRLLWSGIAGGRDRRFITRVGSFPSPGLPPPIRSSGRAAPTGRLFRRWSSPTTRWLGQLAELSRASGLAISAPTFLLGSGI